MLVCRVAIFNFVTSKYSVVIFFTVHLFNVLGLTILYFLLSLHQRSLTWGSVRYVFGVCAIPLNFWFSCGNYVVCVANQLQALKVN